MAQNPIDDVTAALKDAMFVSVGLGVIAFQRMQVRRNELSKAIATQAEEARGALDVVGGLVGERLKAVEERVGATLDRTR
ncbi:MAG: hypothetical protein ACJ739_10795 [Acidimicrobiales bacterium]